MGQTQVGKNGLFRFGSDVVLDSITGGGSGYPLLFQRGETAKEFHWLTASIHTICLLNYLSVILMQFQKNLMYSFILVIPVSLHWVLLRLCTGPLQWKIRTHQLATIGYDATHITFGVATLVTVRGIQNGRVFIYRPRTE